MRNIFFIMSSNCCRMQLFLCIYQNEQVVKFFFHEYISSSSIHIRPYR